MTSPGSPLTQSSGAAASAFAAKGSSSPSGAMTL
jgi:hypothetical protein